MVGNSGSPFVTVTDLAGRYGVSRPHIYEMIASGQLRALKLGRVVRIPVDAVEEFERTHMAGPAA